jgi:hypothetical protein
VETDQHSNSLQAVCSTRNWETCATVHTPTAPLETDQLSNSLQAVGSNRTRLQMPWATGYWPTFPSASHLLYQKLTAHWTPIGHLLLMSIKNHHDMCDTEEAWLSSYYITAIMPYLERASNKSFWVIAAEQEYHIKKMQCKAMTLLRFSSLFVLEQRPRCHWPVTDQSHTKVLIIKTFVYIRTLD